MLQSVIGAGAQRAAEGETKPGPSFLFIGAGKAGSSWFMEILWEHPGVFVPPNKGTYFFTNHYGMGLPWYEGFFSGSAARVAGEVCEGYLASPEALARIRKYRPDMRIICCLRNPYERAISSWRFFARNGEDQPTLVKQAERNPDVFEFGYYATQLQRVRTLFPDDQILVILFEELTTAPENVARRLYEFIGADPEFVPQSLRQRVNPSGRPRSRRLAHIVHRLHMRAWGPSRVTAKVVGSVKRIGLIRRAIRRLLYDERPHTGKWQDLMSEFPQQIITRYEQEISSLEQMLGRDLSSWRAPVGVDRDSSYGLPQRRTAGLGD